MATHLVAFPFEPPCAGAGQGEKPFEPTQRFPGRVEGTADGAIVEVGDARLYAEVAGTGPPVVLLHTGISDRTMWAGQFRSFQVGYRVVRYDARGYGKTQAPVAPYAPHEDLFAIMDAFGIQRAHLIGASMGGTTAIDAALAEPERVAGLVLVAPGLAGYALTDRTTLNRLSLIEAAYGEGDYDRATELELDLWVVGLRRRLADVDPQIVEQVRTMLRASLPASAQFELRRPQPPAIERLGSLDAQTLLVLGDSDVPDMARIGNPIVREAPRVRKVVMSGVAHLPSMERPNEFNAFALGHLDRATEELS